MRKFAVICFVLVGVAIWPATGRSESDKVFTDSEKQAPARAAEKTMDLEQAISLAIANNPSLAAAGYDTEASRSRKDMASGARLPEINAQGAYFHHLDEQRLAPARQNGESGVFGKDLFSADLMIKMPLYAGGRLVGTLRAEEFLLLSSENRMARTRGQLVFNVASTFYSILAQERRIASLTFSKDALEAHLKKVNALIEGRKAARVDRLRTEVRLAEVKQTLVSEKNILMIQHRLLVNLMGIKSAQGQLVLQGTLEKGAPEQTSVEAAVARAFEQRPDFKAAGHELESQAQRVDVARAGHLPAINLVAGYEGRWMQNAEDPQGADDSHDTGKIGVQVEMPLFEGGRIQAKIAEEKAKYAAARERLRQSEFQIRMEVETAVLGVQAAFERITTIETAIELSRENLNIESEKYQLSKGAVSDVLDAQSALLDTETIYYRALADYNIAKAQLDLVTGDRVK